ncbi:MAG: 50S ribosomal protein L11 methyltransferase [Candidatus Binatia bacterium]|nr:50S ribosomal protein L11 methyltransferase [Candidatus Binatia bacterium]
MAARKQKWTRLRLPVPLEATDAIAALCIELGAPGVVTGQTDFRRKKKTSTRVARTTRIEAYFPPDVPRRRLEKQLRTALEGVQTHFAKLDPKRANVEPFETGDYGNAWRAHFPPITVGKYLVIAPSWHDVEDEGKHILRVDPGQAFGTGHHPTTRGCLLEVEQACAKTPPKRGLDVGCGSGVLALAMRAFGVRRVAAVDNDPIAIEATIDAAKTNGLGPIATGASLQSRRGRYDLIVANLFANLLAELAPALAARLTPGGKLIVSGLLDSQEKDVRKALRGAGLRIRRRRCLSTWVTLVAQAPAAPEV